MGLTWSLCLLRYLYLGGIWQGLYLRSGHPNDMCYDEIGLCAQNCRHHSRFNSKHHYWEGLYDRLKRKKSIFTSTSYNFEPRFWSLEWHSFSSTAIANWMRSICGCYLWAALPLKLIQYQCQCFGFLNRFSCSSGCSSRIYADPQSIWSRTAHRSPVWYQPV